MMLVALFYLALSSLLIGVAASWLTGALLSAGLLMMGRRRLRITSASWFYLGISPILVGGSFALFSLSSGWLSQLGWIPDHCTQHPGHPHLCLAHIAQSPPGGIFFWLGCVWLGVFATLRAGDLLSSSRMLKSLSAGSEVAANYKILPSRIAAAFTAGWIFPRVYITTAALRLLNVAERKLVLDHEKEHVRRRDPLRHLLLSFTERLVPILRPVRQQWLSVSEMECDQRCLANGASGELVAATILKLKRANRGQSSELGLLHYAPGDSQALKNRLEGLFSEHSLSSWRCQWWTSLVLFWIVSVALFAELHHAMETVLGWLN